MINNTAKIQLANTIKMIDGAYAPATIRAYRTNFENYIKFCDEAHAVALPSEPETVARFIQQISDGHLKSSSIRISIASISAIHRLNNLEDPTQNPLVKIELRRMHRNLGREAKQAFGITQPILNKMIETTDNSIRGIRDRALLLVAYDTMCRRSELVSLRLEDVVADVLTGQLKIKLRKSKTDQYKLGRWLFLSQQTQRALNKWIKTLNCETGFIFRAIKNNNGISNQLNCSQVNRIYKQVARKVNLSNEIVQNISGHSMRVGAAQDLLIGGASLSIIMSRGRWSKTDTVMRYIEYSKHQ